MLVLETCDKKNRVFRERYYYDKYMPLYNRRRPGLNEQEWDEREVRDCMFRILRTIELRFSDTDSDDDFHL